uniref:AP2/ERF domain-containing protein n=1 Tax=Vitrella brassicaformis TaxID=1169539 RepID=A0A7S1P1J1_9ALVE
MRQVYFHDRKQEWRARYIDNGHRRMKTFSSNKYGYHEAKKLADEWAEANPVHNRIEGDPYTDEAIERRKKLRKKFKKLGIFPPAPGKPRKVDKDPLLDSDVVLTEGKTRSKGIKRDRDGDKDTDTPTAHQKAARPDAPRDDITGRFKKSDKPKTPESDKKTGPGKKGAGPDTGGGDDEVCVSRRGRRIIKKEPSSPWSPHPAHRHPTRGPGGQPQPQPSMRRKGTRIKVTAPKTDGASVTVDMGSGNRLTLPVLPPSSSVLQLNNPSSVNCDVSPSSAPPSVLVGQALAANKDASPAESMASRAASAAGAGVGASGAVTPPASVVPYLRTVCWDWVKASTKPTLAGGGQRAVECKTVLMQLQHELARVSVQRFNLVRQLLRLLLDGHPTPQQLLSKIREMLPAGQAVPTSFLPIPCLPPPPQLTRHDEEIPRSNTHTNKSTTPHTDTLAKAEASPQTDTAIAMDRDRADAFFPPPLTSSPPPPAAAAAASAGRRASSTHSGQRSCPPI